MNTPSLMEDEKSIHAPLHSHASKMIVTGTIVVTLLLSAIALVKLGMVYEQNECMLRSYANRIDVDLARKNCYPPITIPAETK